MSENTTPAAVGSSAELGLAPERANLPPQIGRLLKQGQRFGQPVYSAEQMHAYAAQAVAAERERIDDMLRHHQGISLETLEYLETMRQGPSTQEWAELDSQARNGA